MWTPLLQIFIFRQIKHFFFLNTDTLRQLMQILEGLLMHFNMIINRRSTSFTSQEMGHQWPRGGWSGDCPGIWETEAPISPTPCPPRWGVWETLPTRSELTVMTSIWCLTAASVGLPAQDFSFHLSQNHFTLHPASLWGWLLCGTTVLALQAGWAMVWCLNWKFSPFWGKRPSRREGCRDLGCRVLK